MISSLSDFAFELFCRLVEVVTANTFNVVLVLLTLV